MSKTTFVDKQKIGELLNNIVTDRDVLSKVEYTTWELIFDSVKQLTEYLESELKQWKGTKATMYHGGEALFQLKDITNVFIDKCKNKGKTRTERSFDNKESLDFLDNYRKKAIPLIIAFASQLESEHPLRIEIEKELNRYNVPMMF